MPRRKRRKSAPDLTLETKAVHAISETFVLPFFRLPKILISAKPLKDSFAEQRKYVIADVIGVIFALSMVVIVYVSWPWSRSALNWILIFAGVMFVPASLIGYLRRHRRPAFPTIAIEGHLKRALEIMDSTAKWYKNEDEANRELVTCLRSLGVDAVYGYKLPNGRTADAKVDGVLVEGKLSPDTSEVDRLLGQLSDYARYGSKVNVMIYGELTSEARRRIENEIQLHYPSSVSLTYLSRPRRRRAES